MRPVLGSHLVQLSTVSIHAPREGCDSSGIPDKSSEIVFQFTHPGRGATGYSLYRQERSSFQFTHPGRGATRDGRPSHRRARVSIHAPREGCDFGPNSLYAWSYPFQFTHPGRGATSSSAGREAVHMCFNSRTPGGVRRLPILFVVLLGGVSIHAPREGCD